jgi:hypothetical protein
MNKVVGRGNSIVIRVEIVNYLALCNERIEASCACATLANYCPKNSLLHLLQDFLIPEDFA